MNTTTKRFARTLAEAFPGDAHSAIEGPFRSSSRLSDLLITLACVAVVLWSAIEWVQP